MERKRENQMLTVDTTFLIEEVGVITGTAVPEARQDTAISHLHGAGHSQIRQDHWEVPALGTLGVLVTEEEWEGTTRGEEGML